MAGNTDAACNLGTLLLVLQGEDGPADYEKARYWLELVSRAGDELTGINLAAMYAMEMGVAKKYPQGLGVAHALTQQRRQSRKTQA